MMVTCIFEKILDYNTYICKCGDKELEIMIEFIGIDKPNVGDKMLIHEDLLDTKLKHYTQPYTFIYLEDYEPILVQENEDKEYIILRINDENFSLKRIYG